MRFQYAIPAIAIAIALGQSGAPLAGPAAVHSPLRIEERQATPALTTVAPSPLRINEILAGPARDWDGSGTISTRDDEWIELFNAGPGTVELSSFFVTDGDSIPRISLSGPMAPGERRLVFGGDSYAWEKATGHPAFGLSLGNTGDQVILWQVVGADSQVVDRYAYLAHEAAADRAVGRVPDGSGEWMLLDALDPYTGTLSPPATGCSPTPGWANACAATPAKRVSWGGLKSIYR